MHGLTQDAHPAVTDDGAGAAQAAPQLLFRQKAGPLQMTREHARVPDLGEPGDAESMSGGIGSSHQIVEAGDEGPHTDQDQSSTPRLRIACGKAFSFSGHCTTKRSLKG